MKLKMSEVLKRWNNMQISYNMELWINKNRHIIEALTVTDFAWEKEFP